MMVKAGLWLKFHVPVFHKGQESDISDIPNPKPNANPKP